MDSPATPDAEDRERDLAAIRATYARYQRERGRIWDLRNPGFARIVRDRDGGLIDLLRRSLPSQGGAVLDLGSGDGRLAEVARRADLPFSSWTGADLDPGAVAVAESAMPWARWVEASADRLPIADASIDIVVASTLFSSLPSRDLEEAVAGEIVRVLRLDGWLAWYDLRFDNPFNRAVHGIGISRLVELFPGWRTQVGSITLLPPMARRLGPATGVLYGPLERVPFLRSHLIGRLGRSEGPSPD